MRPFFLSLFALTFFAGFANKASADHDLSRRDLKKIDRLAIQLVGHAKELHDEYHGHLEGVRHSEKLDDDVTQLEKIAEALHDFAHNASGSNASMKRLRTDTNEIFLLSHRISRTIDLIDPWLRSHNSHMGVQHMRATDQEILAIALQIDSYLPVDTEVIDDQTARLEKAVKKLHDEFHDHLEGYEVSRHLDQDLEELEERVEHLHDLAHGKSWADINLRHVSKDVRQIIQKTQHIEELFVQQARTGIRTRDWIGIEHARDAITDILASAELLDHMVHKADSRIKLHGRRGSLIRCRNRHRSHEQYGHDRDFIRRHNDHDH